MDKFLSSKYYNRTWNLNDTKVVMIKLEERTPLESVKRARPFPAIDMRKEKLDSAKFLLTPRAYEEIKNGREVDEALSGMGSIGASLSHINLWYKLSISGRNEDTGLLIVEDDADLNVSIEDAYEQMKNMQKGLVISSTIFSDLSKLFHGLTAYYLTPRMASYLLKKVFPLNEHIDKYLFYMYEYDYNKNKDNMVIMAKPITTNLGNFISTLNHSALKFPVKHPGVISILTIMTILAVVCVVLTICVCVLCRANF